MNVVAQKLGHWQPAKTWSREQVLAASEAVLAKASGAVNECEDIFRLTALGLDWDIGVRVYEPATIARGADGQKVGIFLLHGGAGDYKSMEKFAHLFAEKFGFKVVTMTFPGRLYLDDDSRDWPGDTIKPDGTVRTPIWQRGEYVTPDQYELVRDTDKRMKYGARTSARAKPGTRFYDRMSSWPMAFEGGMKEACRRHFPTEGFSIYVHGHSTGGPYVSMLSQRVPNIAGVIAIENSTFGYINEKKHQWGGHVGKIEGFSAVAPKSAESWQDPFNDLYIRTWRDLARYRGSEALGQEGPQALMRLPWLMEEILDAWDVAKKRPQFKAEYMITHNIVGALEAAARAAAARLKMSADDTESLVAHYLGYTRPLSGPGVKPVPPFLFVISKDSRDHSPEVYREVIIPMFAAMSPAPHTHVLRMGAGVHTYTKPEPGLPVGIAPAAAQFYHDAITGGFFVVYRKGMLMRPKIEWPDGKKICATLTVAFEAFTRGGHFKKAKGLDVNLVSLSHANYGGNAGIWRILEVLERNGARATVDVNGLAVQKWPDAVKALHDAGNEIAGHGTTNDIHMTDLTPDEQRKEIREVNRIVKEVIGEQPVGWVSPGGHHTRETLGILADEGYTWCGDQCDDDLPYVVEVDGKRMVIVPKHWFFNDWRAWNGGASSSDMAFQQFKDGFDFVLEEARRGKPGRVDALVHAELGGRPYMANAFEKMIRYVRAHDDVVWFPTRDEIADHVLQNTNYVEPYSPTG